MVAMPKVMIRGWALEAGTYVRMKRLKARRDRVNPTMAEHAARSYRFGTRIDAERSGNEPGMR
jgi:hypothetical protein